MESPQAAPEKSGSRILTLVWLAPVLALAVNPGLRLVDAPRP